MLSIEELEEDINENNPSVPDWQNNHLINYENFPVQNEDIPDAEIMATEDFAVEVHDKKPRKRRQKKQIDPPAPIEGNLVTTQMSRDVASFSILDVPETAPAGKKKKIQRNNHAADDPQKFNPKVSKNTFDADAAIRLMTERKILDKEKEKGKEDFNSIGLQRRRTILQTKLSSIEEDRFLGRFGSPQDIPRPKMHWDYLLDEVQWMAIDFRQELRWKIKLSSEMALSCKESLFDFYQKKELSTGSSKADLESSLRIISMNISSSIKHFYQDLENEIVNISSATKRTHLESQQKFSELESDDNVEAIVEKVLSIPQLLHSSTSLSEGSAPSSPTSKQLVEFSDLLIPFQQELLKEICRISFFGFGTVVYGPSFSGKTVAIGATLFNWLQISLGKKRRRSELENEESGTSDEAYIPDIAIIVGSPKGILRWLLMINQHFQGLFNIVLANADGSIDLNPSKLPICTIVLLEFENFQAISYLQQSGVNICAAVIDLRSFSASDDRSASSSSTLGSSNSNMTTGLETCPSPLPRHSSATSPLDIKLYMIDLSRVLSPHIRKRIVVTDDTFRTIDRLSTIAVLVPDLSYEQLERRFGSDASEKLRTLQDNGIVSMEQINRNTLNQLLINLSIHANIPSDINARAYAQVREEIISVEFSPEQQLKYDELSNAVIQTQVHLGVETGRDIAKIAAIFKLLCFHSDLIRLDSRSSEEENVSDHQKLWGITFGESHRLSIYPGALVNKLIDPFLIYSNDITDYFEGSNKLRVLKSQLQKFQGLRVVVLATTWLEICLIHKFLNAEKISHIFPRALLKKECSSSESTTHLDQRMYDDLSTWLGEEMGTQMFNNPSVLDTVLLATTNAFKAPSMSAWIADAIIVLSHDWQSYSDIKNCFRLRLIKTGPLGDPVTIVRVCSKGSIEDVMVKHKASIPALQGIKITELGLVSKAILDPEEHRRLANIGFLSDAPTLQVGKRSVSFSSLTANPCSPLAKAGLGPMLSSPTETDSQNNSGNESSSHSSLASNVRSGGKGMIVLGPQGKTQFVKQADSNGSSRRLQFRSGIISTLGSYKEDLDEASAIKQSSQRWQESFRLSFLDVISKVTKYPSSLVLLESRDGVGVNSAKKLPLREEGDRNEGEGKAEEEKEVEDIKDNEMNVQELPTAPEAMKEDSIAEAAAAAEATEASVASVASVAEGLPPGAGAATAVAGGGGQTGGSGSQWLSVQKAVFSSSVSSMNQLSLQIFSKSDERAELTSSRKSLYEVTSRLSMLSIAHRKMMSTEDADSPETLILTERDREELRARGVGTSETNLRSRALFMPSLPDNNSSSSTGQTIGAAQSDAIAASASLQGLQSSAQSSSLNNASRLSAYNIFRDSLNNHMRSGVAVDPWLHVNPLQTASRRDLIYAPTNASASSAGRKGTDSAVVSIRYVNKPAQIYKPPAPRRQKASYEKRSEVETSGLESDEYFTESQLAKEDEDHQIEAATGAVKMHILRPQTSRIEDLDAFHDFDDGEFKGLESDPIVTGAGALILRLPPIADVVPEAEAGLADAKPMRSSQGHGQGSQLTKRVYHRKKADADSFAAAEETRPVKQKASPKSRAAQAQEERQEMPVFPDVPVVASAPGSASLPPVLMKDNVSLSAVSQRDSSSGSGSAMPWLPWEDNALIIMREVFDKDSNFIYAGGMLNRQRSKRELPQRTMPDITSRYEYLRSSGKVRERLADPTAMATVARLKEEDAVRMATARVAAPRSADGFKVAENSSFTFANNSSPMSPASASSSSSLRLGAGQFGAFEKISK